MRTSNENGITIYEEEEHDIVEVQTPLTVVAASYLEDYKIHIIFSDCEERIIDFESKLRSFPPLHKFLKINTFKKFRLYNGNIQWNDFEMIFPVEDLYKM